MYFRNIVKIVFLSLSPRQPCSMLISARWPSAGRRGTIFFDCKPGLRLRVKWGLNQLYVMSTPGLVRVIEIKELLGTMYFPFVGKTYKIGIFEIRVFRYNLATSHLVMIQLWRTYHSIAQNIVHKQSRMKNEGKKTIWSQFELNETSCIQ